MEEVVVLSLFDGISCGQVAFERAGFKVKTYLASEVDKYAIQVTQKNWPNTVQLGSVTSLDTSILPKIDFLIGGSPCQSFSFAGKRKGMITKDNVEVTSLEQYLRLKEEGFEFEGQSYLFWEYVRVLKEVKPKYFLLENVKMVDKWKNLISETLGVEPIAINSELVSAQGRKRLYWTNIPNVTAPEDKGIMLRDIAHEANDEVLDTVVPNFNVNPSGKGMNGDVYSVTKDKSKTLTTNKGEGQKISVCIAEYIVPFDETLQVLDKEVQLGKFGYFRKDSQANRVYYMNGKSITLTGESGGGAAKMGQYIFGSITPISSTVVQENNNTNGGKIFYTLTAQKQYGVLVEGYIRKLTPIECERLQTLKDNYTEGISNSQRYKCLGNGWTVDVVAHILSFAKNAC
jgi:DNA-cytosine methyltransferase